MDRRPGYSLLVAYEAKRLKDKEDKMFKLLMVELVLAGVAGTFMALYLWNL